MAVSNIKATFQGDVQRVWEVVTSLESYSWRSDLSIQKRDTLPLSRLQQQIYISVGNLIWKMII